MKNKHGRLQLGGGTPLELELDWGRLAGLAWGDPADPPLLALHGWLDNAASFARLAPLLAQAASLRIVALDLPGHGRSDHRPAGASYHFMDWVPEAFAAADALGWGRFSLLGHSMGAGIACLMAGTLPARVTRLALIEGLGPLSAAAEEAPARLARSLLDRGRQEAFRPMHDLAEAAERVIKGSARSWGPEGGLSKASAELLVARGTRPLKPTEGGGCVWSWDPRLRHASAMRLSEAQVRAFLARIDCPALVIQAQQGLPFDAQLLAGRAAELSQLTPLRLPGHHRLHLDDPEPVAAVLQRFFASLV